LFRKALRRVLKPYTVRQREFETSVVEALQDALYSEVDIRSRLFAIEENLEEILRRIPAADQARTTAIDEPELEDVRS